MDYNADDLGSILRNIPCMFDGSGQRQGYNYQFVPTVRGLQHSSEKSYYPCYSPYVVRQWLQMTGALSI